MPKPLLFISHKHSDREIASAISNSIEERTLGEIEIYQSSDPKFEGPKIGANLNKELNDALWRCDVLILVYTSTDNDWSYCMYECGVATDRNSPDTKIIVFQCGKEVPDVFKGKLKVKARSPEQIEKFTKELLTNPKFFPSLKRALAPNVDKETIQKVGNQLYTNLKKSLPELVNNVEEWPAFPYLRIGLPQVEVDRIANATSDMRLSLAVKVIREHGTIYKNDSRIAQIFGLTSLPEKGRFAQLVEIWEEKYPDEPSSWFESCCEQIMTGARREFPVVKNATIRQVDGTQEYTPVMSRVKYLAFENNSQFDIYFYNLNDPRALPVSSQMIHLKDMFVKKVGKVKSEAIKLKDLVEEIEKLGRNRIPILDDNNYPLQMIHRSMIDKFVANNVFGKSGVSPAEFTLKHLLEEEEFKEMFENSFVVVSKNTSLSDAKSAMLSKQPYCSDVFITANGSNDEPIIGWLTNIEMAKVT